MTASRKQQSNIFDQSAVRIEPWGAGDHPLLKKLTLSAERPASRWSRNASSSIPKAISCGAMTGVVIFP